MSGKYLDTLFQPRSIAVIGASTKEGSVGNDVLKNIVSGGYEGEVYPINPKGGQLYGLSVKKDIDDVEDVVDLAIIIIPAETVPQVLKQCGEKGIRSVIIISAGFRESGKYELEKEIVQIAKSYDMTLLGPNCLGILCPSIKLNASFAPLMPQSGGVAFLSQSGALCASILDWSREYNIGFSKFVSTGNKAILDEYALLSYFMEDESTKVIAMYVEDLPKTNEIITFLRSHKKTKPIIVLKSGRTQEGTVASSSHTGALAGSDEAYDAVFAQANIIRVYNARELLIAMKVFSSLENIPKVMNTAIITNAGGPGVLATDALANLGVGLSILSEGTLHVLHECLPEVASTHNPIDVLGDARSDRYRQALEVVCNDNSVGMVLVIITPQSMTEVEETARAIIDVSREKKILIVSVLMGGELVMQGKKLLEQSGCLTASIPEEGATMLSLVSRYAKNSEPHIWKPEEVHVETQVKEKVESIFQRARSKDIFGLPEAYALPVLETMGFHTLRSLLASTPEEAKRHAFDIGGRVVLKIVSPDILHKSDVGGIRVGVEAQDVESIYAHMLDTVRSKVPDARVEGIMVVEMAPERGLHMVVGAKRDPNIGPVIMVGLGGIYVEILKDVSFGVLPLTQDDANRMVRSLRTFDMLNGARGKDRLDVEALSHVVLKIAHMMRVFEEIDELDINPLLVLPRGEGVVVMDARIALATGAIRKSSTC